MASDAKPGARNLRRAILGLMRHGFSETEVLAMTETAFVQYLDILAPGAGKQTGVTRFVNAKKPARKTT